jgi:hypothetical protein
VEHRFEKNSIDLHTAETYGGNKNVEENAKLVDQDKWGKKLAEWSMYEGMITHWILTDCYQKEQSGTQRDGREGK